MKNDTEAAMVSFFLLRGHSLDSLLKLSSAEKIVYMAAMERHYEDVSEMIDQKKVV